MKVYDRDPRKTLLADKYLVRDWVKEKIGEEYLIPLLAVYRSAKEIDFDSLPDAFVLKANHGNGMNAIIRNKQSENLEAIRSRAEGWLRQNFTFSYGYELQYNDIPRRIIVEKYMESHNGVMTELKVWCFSGKIGFLQIVRETLEEKSHAFFDKDWNKTSFFTTILPLINEDIPAPGNLSKIIQIAETLSSGFPFVRVDLYLLEDGTIKFGEMTFSPASGIVQWNSPEADKFVGNLLTLPEIS